MKRFLFFLLFTSTISQNLSASDGVNPGDVSFNPFKVHESSEGDKGVIWAGSIASAMAPLLFIGPFAGPFGLVISGILASAVLIFATRNNLNPDEMYQKIWGKIEIQINGAINAKAAAQMKDRLNTLSHNVHDQSVAYLSAMGISNTADIITNPNPSLTANQVDLMMRPFDDILSASNGWYSTTPANLQNPDAFVLAKTDLDKGERRCLHTRKHVIDDGTELVVDSECKMDSLDDKMFAIEDGTQRLLMRTERGVKCVTYNDKKGTNLRKHMAIFDIHSRQCVEGRKIIVKRNGAGFSLYDDGHMLCVGIGKKKNNLNVIVSTKRKKCLNNNSLVFKTMIPIVLNPGSLTPAYSFDELGIQLFYFPAFATYHLTALKEMYLFGTNKRGAKAQFTKKVTDYKKFLAENLPVFQAYNDYVGMGAEKQISEALTFYGILEKSTLDHKPQQFQGLA